MQERRYRPGDVLDDYCPRERRVTDHAIVAMIDDQIQRTRCGICDAEHEYKEAKVPAPRRKTQPPALFTQVLDGLQGPAARLHSPPAPPSPEIPDPPIAAAPPESPAPPVAEPLALAPDNTPAAPITDSPMTENREDGPVRRPLIRATFPKLEGAVPTPRALPEFTIQSLNNRSRPGASRPGGHGKGRGRRRPGGGPAESHTGPMRFGRDNGHGGGQGDGNRPHGQGQGQGQGGGRRRRGGKKNH